MIRLFLGKWNYHSQLLPEIKPLGFWGFFSPIYFYSLEANYFTILQWFLPYIDMNQPYYQGWNLWFLCIHFLHRFVSQMLWKGPHFLTYFTNCISTFSFEEKALNEVMLMCCPYLLYIFLPVTRASRQSQLPYTLPAPQNHCDLKHQTPSYDIPYMWNLKRSDTDELTKQKETHRQKMNSWLLERKDT